MAIRVGVLPLVIRTTHTNIRTDLAIQKIPVCVVNLILQKIYSIVEHPEKGHEKIKTFMFFIFFTGEGGRPLYLFLQPL